MSILLRGAHHLRRSVAVTSKRRLRFEIELIKESALFDRNWYLRSYPDVAKAGSDPLLHYMTHGWREGRDPGPEFATSAYLQANSDVARLGVNPLVHYIEFGHSEGRGTFSHRAFSRSAAPGHCDFAAPAPCVSFPLPSDRPIAWRRGYRLNKNHPQFIARGAGKVGYAKSANHRKTVETAFGLLAMLSGDRKQILKASIAHLGQAAERVQDAWFVNMGQLRTRWTGGDFPFVVRAFQHDPLLDEEACLVAEACVSSPLDVVDIHLNTSFFPLLFAIAEPDGSLRSVSILAFPSLCRGGVHYSELLQSAAVSSSATVDPSRHSQDLAERLLRLIREEAKAAISRVEVDLDGGDGTGPLFQRDFQLWLDRVFQLAVEPAAAAGGTSRAERFLADAVAVEPSRMRVGAATLVLRHDMVPTIAALTEPHRRGEPGDQSSAALIIAGAEPSDPVTCAELPADALQALDALPRSGASMWPRLKPGPSGRLPRRFPPAAILLPAVSAITDAELIIPVSGNGLETGGAQRRSITWIIEDCVSTNLHSQAIESLALQDGAAADVLALVGRIDPTARAVADEHFGGRVKVFANIDAAAQNLETPLVGFIAGGVILHDSRSAHLLSSLLESDDVVTASCVLISVENRGRAWHATIAAAGAMATLGDDTLGEAEISRVVRQMWRSNFPVAAPPANLWVTRSSCLQSWVGEAGRPDTGEGLHMCTSLVTASYVGDQSAAEPAIPIPKPSSDRATKVEVVFG